MSTDIASPKTATGSRNRRLAFGCAVLLLLIVGAAVAVWQWRIGPRAPESAVHASLSIGVPRPIYPDRPAPVVMEGNIELYPMTLAGSGAGLPMHVWLYLPKNRDPAVRLPCVVIAPAGTRLLHGAELSEGDMPEHLPCVRAGFAVLAYSLSGSIPGNPRGRLRYDQMINPVREFMAADGGLANARNAVDFIAARVPEVDMQRLYAVGHSSAATMALNAAAIDHRFRAVVAYAPACDVEARWGNNLTKINELAPGALNLAARVSPMRHIPEMACPVFLFHADDDQNIDTRDNLNYLKAMTAAGKSIEMMRLARGGHYPSMISQGIPAGIAFMIAHGANPSPR